MVGYLLYGIALPMRIVVHRIDAPFIAGTVVFGMQDTVHDGVAQQHVRVRHVNLGTEHFLSVGEFAGPHAGEKVKILLHTAVAPRTLGTGHGHRTARLAYLLLRLVVHIGQSLLNQLYGPCVELLEIVRGIMLFGPPETEPPDILLDGIDILHILLNGIGIVETEVAQSSVPLRKTEIKADALGMAYMQVAVGFRRETGMNSPVHTVDMVFYYLFQKIEGTFPAGRPVVVRCHNGCLFRAKLRFLMFSCHFNPPVLPIVSVRSRRHGSA